MSAKRAPVAEVYRSPANHRWYWRLKAANGQVIATSAGGKANGYSNQYNAIRGFNTVAVAFARLVGPDGHAVEVRVVAHG